MVRSVRDRFGSRGAKVAKPQAGAPEARLPGSTIAPEEPVATLLSELDIGADAFVKGPRYAFDIDIDVLPQLLSAVARHAAVRGQRAFVQIPGHCLPITERLKDERLADIDGRPRFRILITDANGQQAENIAVELWKLSSRAYRSLSDDNDIRLSIPGAAPPARGPAPTEQGIEWPIDIVYTWVDAADPEWRIMASEHLELPSLETDLYTQTDELRYSLRSVQTFAPWVNHVYVLSNCAPPSWFGASEKVTWVDHREVAEPELLPLLNSGAIDTLLHRIPGLSEHFLYLNDDFMLWDSVTPATFFTWDDRTIARMAMNSSLIYLQQLVEAGRAQPSQHSHQRSTWTLRRHIRRRSQARWSMSAPVTAGFGTAVPGRRSESPTKVSSRTTTMPRSSLST